MIKTLTFTLLLATACSISFAQNRNAIDSLRRELSETVQDTNQVTRMKTLADLYWTYKTDSAFFFAQSSLDLSRKIKYPKGESNALTILALINSVSGNSTKSLELLFKALKVAEQNGLNGFEKAHAMYNIGQYYSIAREDAKAISYLQQSKGVFDSLHLSMMSQLARTSLGLAYLAMNQMDSAIKYCQLAYDEMIRNNARNNLVEATTYILNNLASVFAKKGNTEMALVYFRQSLSFSAESYPRRSQAYHGIAKLYQQLNVHDSAIFYAKSSLAEAQKGAYYANMIDAGSLLSELYDPSDLKLAFKYNKLASASKDSLAALEFRTAYKNLTEFDEKERQYEIETATASYQNKVKLYSLLAGLGVFLVIAFILYRNSRKQKEANAILRKQKQEIETQKKNVEETLDLLKSTQAQLIQSEKMASLGELTAGIAHEIQNPLNFVNNFSEVNKELTIELEEELKRGNLDDVQSIAKDIRDNEEKINYHGRRADAIVKNMLQHSRTASGTKEPVNINDLTDEYLRLAYHGFRTRDKNFNASLNSSFDQSIGNINVVPQDIGRVLLNLFNNAFYTVADRKKAEPDFEPAVNVSTKKQNAVVEISVKDNGAGIPQHVVDKIFQPFFTTKPTGQGTGLGLSLAYDIIKAHGGEIKVTSTEGQGSEFLITLNANS